MDGDTEVPVPVCHRSLKKPQSSPQALSFVTCRRKFDGRHHQERNQRAGCMQVTKEREGENGENVQRNSRQNSSRAKRERGVVTEQCSRVEPGSEMTRQKTIRGLRGKGKLTPPTFCTEKSNTGMPGSEIWPSQSAMETGSDLQMSQSAMETGSDLQLGLSAMETGLDRQTGQSAVETGPDLQPSQSITETEAAEPPESPPPMKRWVIGPLLQSLKSKMASFTEIVMSPVRLFKPVLDNHEGSMEGDAEPGKQDLVEIPPQINESLQARAPLRGAHDDQHGGGGILFSEETQGEPQLSPERSSMMHERLQVIRSGKRGKELKKKKDDMKEESEVLIIPEGEVMKEVRPDQDSSIRPETCASQVIDTDLHRSLSSSQVVGKNRQGSCLTKAKGRGGRRENLKVECSSIVEFTHSLGGKCTDSMTGSPLDFKVCSTNNSSTEDGMTESKITQGKNPTGFHRRKLRSSAFDLEDTVSSPNHSIYDSETITTEIACKEENATGSNKTDAPLKDARRKCLKRECQHYSRRKRELSPGIGMDPILNEKYLAMQEKQGASTCVPSDVPKEHNQIQGIETRSWRKLRRARQQLGNHVEAGKGVSKKQQQLCKEGVEKQLIVGKGFDREATPLGESSPCVLDAQEEEAISEDTCFQARGSLPEHVDPGSQVQPKMCMLMRVGRKRGGSSVKGNERATRHVSSSPQLLKSRRRRPETSDEEELKSGQVHSLIDKEVPQKRRKKSKQRDNRMVMAHDSRRPKSGGFFKARGEQKEDFANEGEQLKESGSFEKPGCGSLPSNLRRSYSCPEFPSLLRDGAWTSPLLPSVPQSRLYPSPVRHCLPVALPPSSAKRVRRHTVCSVEVEREIAPLCLRKEVFPAGSGGQYYNPNSSASSTSFSALAACFLSSPLAFLSRKQEESSLSGSISSSSACSCDVTTFSCSDATPSTSSPVSSLVNRLLPDSSSCALPRSSQSTASISSFCSVFSQTPVGGETEGDAQQQQEEEEEVSCFSPQHETIELRDEKSLSDSEIKVGCAKQAERGQVSRIKIRRTPPKPLTNLTPMGLPRPVRLKKKDFSLEEIYTNKNFHKPPEGRLETIFEVPTSKCDGSLCLIGSRRLKRLVNFPKLGVPRKPRKPLSGVGKGAKAGDGSVVGRTRRRGASRANEGPSHSMEELDSLLCSKLDELDAWVASEQAAL